MPVPHVTEVPLAATDCTAQGMAEEWSVKLASVWRWKCTIVAEAFAARPTPAMVTVVPPMQLPLNTASGAPVM